MTTNVGTGVFRLEVDPSGLEDGLADAEQVSKDRFDGIKKGALAMSATIGAIGLVGAKLGQDMEVAFGKIQAKTGATGAELDDLKQSFKNVARNSTSSMEDVASTMGEVERQTGLTGKALEDATSAALLMSNTLGFETEESLLHVGNTLKSFGLDGEDTQRVLTNLAGASQKWGLDINVMAESLSEFTPQLKQMGLGVESSIGLFGQLHEAGIPLEVAMQELASGVERMEEEGYSAEIRFRELTDAIKYGHNEIEVMTTAAEFFGPVAQDVVDAVRAGTINIEDLGAAMSGTEDVMGVLQDSTDNYGTRVEKLINSGKIWLGSLFEQDTALGKVTAGFTAGFTAIGPMLTALPALTAATTTLGLAQKAQTVFATAAAIATNLGLLPIIAIAAGIALLIAGIILLIKNWDKVKNVALAVWEVIKKAAELAINGVLSYFNLYIKGINLIIAAANQLPGVNVPSIPELRVDFTSVSPASVATAAPQTAQSGGSAGQGSGGNPIIIEGDVYGVDDFDSKVREAQDKYASTGNLAAGAA